MPVVLLCHADGTNGSTSFTDTWGGHTLTPTACTVSTTSPKFGTGSADFTAGGTSAISVSTPADFNFGAGQFTLEAWAYFTSNPLAKTGLIMGKWISGGFQFFFGFTGGSLTFWDSTDGSGATQILLYNPGAVTLNTWFHIAVDRDAGNTARLYWNGAVVNSVANAVTYFNSTTPLTLGNDGTGSADNLPGRLDEMRVTIGLAQYGGAFSVPTAPFPDPSVASVQARGMILA